MESRMEQVGRRILETLERHGYDAYWVGGCVRDAVMGRPVKDMDIATSAAPEVTAGLFARTVPTGLKHGTVTVLAEEFAYEVTTFRKESAYEDYRRPAGVEFITSLEEDLKRRDFTLNAMAMDRTGAIIDPLGGRGDIAAGRIRAVGDAGLRFREDALRMLRCVRFAADFGFGIEAVTRQALRDHAPLLAHVAMERVRAELERMIAGAGPYEALRMLAEFGLLRHTKRPLRLPLAMWPAAEAVPGELRNLGSLPEAMRRWMLLCGAMDIDAETLGRELHKLTFSRSARSEICRYVAFSRWFIEELAKRSGTAADADSAGMRELWAEGAVRYGADTLRNWLAVSPFSATFADELVPRGMQMTQNEGRRWLDAIPAAAVSDLDLTGQDLIQSAGLPPGPWIGRVLDELLLEAAAGKVPNRKTELLDRAQYHLKRLNAHE